MGPRTPHTPLSCDEPFKDSQEGASWLPLRTSLLLHPEFPSLNNRATLFPNRHHWDSRALLSHGGDSAISLLRNCPWLPTPPALTPLPGILNGLWSDPKLPLILSISLLSLWTPAQSHLQIFVLAVPTTLSFRWVPEGDSFKVILPGSGMKLTHGVWSRGSGQKDAGLLVR